RRRVVVFAGDTLPDLESDVAVVDTESRALDPTAAAERVGSRASCLRERLAAGTVFKKIDSTLRGPIGAEMEALLATTGRRSALICPSFPDQRRVVRDGLLLVGGVPVHESPVARDPAYAGTTARVADIVTRGCARPVSSLPLARVRGDREDLVRT